MKNESRINQFKQIAKAITSKAPDGDWYQKRLDICGACEYNTKNKEDKSMLDRAQNAITPACSICHCFISEKAKLEESVCGLVEIDKEPKWYPVSIPSKVHNGVTISNLTEDSGNLESVPTGAINYKIISENQVEKFKIGFRGKNIKSVTVGCGCTTVLAKELGPANYELDCTLSTVGFSNEKETTRAIYVEYYITPVATKKMTINLKITKNGK